MVFSSTLFLFAFLPLVLLASLVAPRSLRNPVLLVASLAFYAWGEGLFVAVMLGSALVNWLLGLALAGGSSRRLVVTLSVVFNIGLLVAFKYAGFVMENLNALLRSRGVEPIPFDPIHLPIGVSFFTFQALSYVIDVSRGQAEPQRRPFDLALYIALFPQLIAGPIVRYRDVALQLRERTVDLAGFAGGVSRFVVGLGKKMLLANTLAVPADRVFSLPEGELTVGLCWLGVACYALQIYFDFSGYSDMAIGLGRMLGFRFLENFDFPYIARSVTEFWRRWHISLSSWFRDYLYIPLGGNRDGALRTYRNLLLVFLLCGLWHGAAWTFVAWGLFHGLFLVLERLGLGDAVARLPKPLRHLYLVVVVLVGWVFFRAEGMTRAGVILSGMVGLGEGAGPAPGGLPFVDRQVLLAGLVGLVGATPVVPRLAAALDAWRARAPRPGLAEFAVGAARNLSLVAILLLCAAALSSGTNNPFIYFRF